MIEVIKDNFIWAVNHGVLDGSLIDTYSAEFNSNGIRHNENVTGGYLLATGNATVRAYGNATVRATGNATVEAYDNAYVISYDIFECKLSDNAIWRIRRTNTIRYAAEDMIFEKQPQ